MENGSMSKVFTEGISRMDYATDREVESIKMVGAISDSGNRMNRAETGNTNFQTEYYT